MKLVIEIIETNKKLTLEIKTQYSVLGRLKSDFILNDTFCSAQHAVLFLNAKNELVITDLKSRNGTFVNGERVGEAVLKAGDWVQLGQTVFKIVEIKENDSKQAESEICHDWAGFWKCLPKPAQSVFQKHAVNARSDG